MKSRLVLGGGSKYGKYPNDIYIKHLNGKLYTLQEWDESWNYYSLVGVAVLAKSCRFVISPKEYGGVYWQKEYGLIPGITTTTVQGEAKSDFKGKENTDAWIARYGANVEYAAGWCHEYAFNGEEYGAGYLGSAGEWNEVYKNKDKINECLLVCRGSLVSNGYYWTSTQHSASYAWNMHIGSGNIGYGGKLGENVYVRAFASL